jgi:intracellular septation protein A
MSAAGTIEVLRPPTPSVPALLPTPSPRLRAIVARTATSLSVACVAPAVLLSVAVLVLNVMAAVVTALVWTCGAMCWRWATSRPPSGLLLVTVVVLIVRSAFTLATGNTYVYFLQPVFANVAVALVFIVSLATATPVVARLAGDFYPMESDVANRPRVQRLFWQLTLMWGIVCLAKGLVTFWLLQAQSQADFVMIKNAAITSITAVTVTATIWLSAVVARKEGLLARA